LRNQVLEEKKKLRQTLEKGYQNLNLVYAFSGKKNVVFLSEFLKSFTPLSIKAVWGRKLGIEVPRFRNVEFPPKNKIPYGFADTSIYLDRSIVFFQESFTKILAIAEMEGELFKLAFEFQKIKRRINALEDLIIPKLQSDIAIIENSLEDLEREEYIQMKEIKKYLAAGSEVS
jgi:V/A-type H+-transporting ATPase subunit D